MCTKDIPRAFGGSAVIAVNHLGLGWNTPAVNQITAWLGAP